MLLRLNPEVVRVYRRLLSYVAPYWYVIVPAVMAIVDLVEEQGDFAYRKDED